MDSFEKMVLAVFAAIAVFVLIYCFKLHYEVAGIRVYTREKKRDWTNLILLMLAALLLKVIFAAMYEGHGTDMGCFQAWSEMIYENGIGKFYYLDAFTDYPPGYMAILWVIAGIRHLFQINMGSEMGRVLIKLVPVLSDLAAGVLLYSMAKKKFSEGSSLLLAVSYVLNPIVVLDSSVWGQTDGVFTLCVLAVCYLCMEERRIPAYFIFALGVLIKPQMLIFTPILIWTIAEQVFLRDFNKKKLIHDLIGGLSAVALMFLLAMPFGLEKVIPQYVDTLGSYEYCTINAYNVWALFGKNWASQSDKFLFMECRQWGMLAIVLAVVLSGLVFFKLKEDKSKYFVSMSIVVSTVFLFSVRMHERYLFPVVVLTLAAFLVKPTAELFFTYVGFSIVQFINVAHVLCAFVEEESTWPQGGTVGVTALLTLAIYGYMFFAAFSKTKIAEMREYVHQKGKKKPEKNYIVVKRQKTSEEKAKENPDNGGAPEGASDWKGIHASRKKIPITKWDIVVLGGIVLFYSLFALTNLGKMSAPETSWSRTEENQGVISLDLGESRDVNMLHVFLGQYENRKFQLELSQDGVSYDCINETEASSVFAWNPMRNTAEGESEDTYNLASQYRYVRITCLDSVSILNELVITDSEGNLLTPVNAADYSELFDEQQEYEAPVTYRSGTYFDEIYHARTAYEMIQDDYNYENTHPPLGKFIISIGIRLFGMNPFGWRIMGVLFGIGMLPFMYFFGRRLFRGKIWAAGILTFLFAFDFMHFTQTRIATIDVYGTFFIIAMFFFMYWYSQMSFYDTPLKKTFVPLGLSAVMMGLGCACKWTAVYAAAGLAVFFFAIMGWRYYEYRQAKNNPQGETAGISHAYVVEVFPKKLLWTLAFCVLFFVIIAGAIYLCSYIPFSDGCTGNIARFSSRLADTSRPVGGLYRSVIEFLQNHQNAVTETIGKMLRNQEAMFTYHSELEATHPFQSAWNEWPVMVRPMYYYCQTLANGMKEGISAFGNPLIWWAGIPAVLYMVYRIIRNEDRTALFLVFAYLVQYVPWMGVPRCTFVYHYFPSVPFVAMMIVYVMVRLVEHNRKWFKWVMIYAAAAFVLFLLFYPVLSGQPVDYAYVRDGLRWLPGWQLVS